MFWEGTITTISEQTMNHLSVEVRKGVWSGLSAGNDGFRAGVVLLSSSNTCPRESGHCRPKSPLHPSQPTSMRSTDAHGADSGLHFCVPPVLSRVDIVRPISTLANH